MNVTFNLSTKTNINSYYIACSLSAICGVLSIIMSVIIIVTVVYTKPRLHTVRHLLICNTCVSSIFYCLAQIVSYIFLIFLPFVTDNISCRLRGYLSYTSIAAASYSYLIQAISRLLFTVYSTKYPRVTTFKTHRLLILIHWSICFILTLPALVTTHIYFRPGNLCWVPMQSFILSLYMVLVCYGVPLLLIGILYAYIYRAIKQAKKRTEFLQNTTSEKRDLEVLRNIIILLGIYIAGGVPTFLYIISSIELLYLFGIVAITLSVFIEKLSTIGLDRELRLVVKGLINLKNRVMPFEHTVTRTVRSPRKQLPK